MLEVRTAPLFQMALQTVQAHDVGETPSGHRTIVKVTGGKFEGPMLKGSVLEGDDWLLLRADNVLELDCRITLKTDDSHTICMTYRGYRHGPEEVISRIMRGEEVDASDYYHRVVPFFETSSEKYGWLNRTVCIAIGHKRPSGGVYSVHQVN